MSTLPTSQEHGLPSSTSPASAVHVEESSRALAPVHEPAAALGFVRRHTPLIVLSMMLAAGAALLVTRFIRPVYETTASIRIDAKPDRLPALEALGLAGDNAVATELEILRSRELSEQVVDSLGLQLRLTRPAGLVRRAVIVQPRVSRDAAAATLRLVRRTDSTMAVLVDSNPVPVQVVRAGAPVRAAGAAFALTPEALQYPTLELAVQPFRAAVEDLQGSLVVARRNRDADILDVRIRDADPQTASDIANVLAQRFIAGRQDVRQSEARNTADFLRGQVALVSSQLASAEQSLRRFREQEKVVDLPAEAQTGVTRRAELLAQRNGLEAERSALSALLAVARQSTSDQATAYRQLLAFPTLLRNGVVSELLGALTTAEGQRSELLTRRTSKDPDVQAAEARIAELHGQVQAMVSTYLQGLAGEVAALDTLLARSDAGLLAIPAKEIRLAELERTMQSNESIYSMLQTRLKEAEIAAAASDESVRLIDDAIVPTRPVFPKPLLSVVLALLAGAMVGLSGAFAREYSDRSLHTRRELLATSGMPVVGLIPHVRRRRRLGKRRQVYPAPALLATARVEPESGTGTPAPSPQYPRHQLVTFTEAYNWLATNLAFMGAEHPAQVLAITSALPGEGKTTVALNLALTMAHRAKRVLLVDADLRGGRVASVCGIAEEPGLADALTSGIDDAALPQWLPLGDARSIDVISRGATRNDAGPLLGQERMASLIAWARERYDLIVLDTPPVNAVADAALVAPQVDGVLVVARAGVTPREALALAMDQLRLVRAPLVGAILNDVDLQRDAAYDRSYRYYGRYSTSTV